VEVTSLIIGLLFIGIGFLVKSVPELIAGYNTMSKEQKKNVDIEGLSTFMRNGFITIGLVIIIGFYVFKWIGLIMIANSMILLTTIVGPLVLVIQAQKFDHNQNKKTKLIYLIFGLIFVFTVGLLTYGSMSSKVIYKNDSVRFSGMYGFEISIAEVDYVKLIDTLPVIKMRTNGFSFGTVKKGFFSLDSFGKSRLFIHSDHPPFLIISNDNGDKTIINFKEKAETETIFNRLNVLINK
jgi:hypothetical protein